MLASLLYGADKLCETKITEEMLIEKRDSKGKVILIDGQPATKVKKSKRTVIDYTKDFKKNMDNIVFKIGHSNS